MIARAVTLAFTTVASAAVANPIDRPNIVVIYGDDVGYGDVSCNGQATLATPNIDRLAAQGVRLTDAHCSAATCTPSRYALLTGRYAFRQDNSAVRPGDANLIISAGTPTLASLLRDAGYATAVVGKWHLGLGMGPIDWNGRIAPGPETIGFDEHFLIPATGDRVPCVYVEQNRVVDLDPADPITVSYRHRLDDEPTGRERPDLLKQRWSDGHDMTIVNGISRIGYMTGGRNARWVNEDMADVITAKAIDFIQRSSDGPFFLYFATHDIHVPRVPHSRFVGVSGLGPRGDAMVQLDWCVGALLDALAEAGVTKNTLVIFTSDNGPVLDDGYVDQANEMLGSHGPSGPYRAGKYSLFEGGTRVPTIVRWPARVTAGGVSQALVGQIDLATSIASLIDATIPPDAFPDGRDQLRAWLGEEPIGRPHLVHEARGLALRQGSWKYVPAGRTRDRLGPWSLVSFGKEGALFDLSNARGEWVDVAADHPERLASMRALLSRVVAGGDSGD